MLVCATRTTYCLFRDSSLGSRDHTAFTRTEHLLSVVFVKQQGTIYWFRSWSSIGHEV